MHATTKYIYKADNGYSLVMSIEFDQHIRIGQDVAEAIGEAEKPAYLIREAVANGIKEYSGMIKIHSRVLTPENEVVPPKEMVDHPVDDLKAKYMEAYRTLQAKGLGVDIRGTMAPLTLIHEEADATPHQQELLAGVYKGIPSYYRIETRPMNRELAEMHFENAVLDAGFEQSKVQKLEGGRGGSWSAGL